MDSVYTSFDCCSLDDFGPERKKQKRDSCTAYKKTVSILKECDIKKTNKHVYRPLDFIMANIKKQKSRFGTVVLSRDMTEEEVRRKMCDAFPILKNNRFNFAAADITGALDYHEESSWTGAEVKRHVPGGSALYIVMEDKKIIESQSEVENVASKEKPDEICENVSSSKAFSKLQKSVKPVEEKTNEGDCNSSSFKQPGISSSSNLFCSNSTSKSCIVFSSSVRETSSLSSNEKALMSKEYIGPDQNKDAKNSGIAVSLQTLENPSVISTHPLIRSSLSNGKLCEEKFRKQDPIMKDKQLYSVARLPTWIPVSRGVCSALKETNASVIQRADGLACDPLKQAHSFGNTLLVSSMLTSPVSSNRISFKRENGIPTYFCTEAIEEVDPVKVGQSNVVAVSSDVKKLCDANLSPVKLQLQSGSIKDTQRTSNSNDISVNNTISSVPLENFLSRNSLVATRTTMEQGTALKTSKTAAVKPSCAGSTLLDKQHHTQTPTACSSENFNTLSLLEENDWSSLLNSSKKKIERTLYKLFEEVAESSEKRLNGSYGIVDDIIPREGPSRGGQEFVIILKEVLPSCFKEDEVIVRFGQDPGAVAVLWKGDKTLLGTTKPVEESGSVRVTVETSGGAVLGHAHFTYLNPVVEALKHVVYSQEIAPLFLAILEQTIQGCGENSGAAQDPEGRRKSSYDSNRAAAQSLLELMVYIAAQSGSHEFVRTVFSSTLGETAVNTYTCRAMRPEHVASKMGHQQLAEYLEEQFKRVSLLITRSVTANENVDVSLASASNQDKSPCERSNSQPTSLMLLSDVAMGLNEADEEISRSTSQVSYTNGTECLKNTPHPKNINVGTTNRENLVYCSGDTQLTEFLQSCNANSAVKERLNQLLVSKNGRLRDSVFKSSKESKMFPTTPKQILCQSEFVQKVVMLKEKLPTSPSLVVPGHVNVAHVTSKNVLLNVQMSEREVKAKVACCFQLPEHERILFAIADSCDRLSIGEEEKLSGLDVFRMTRAGRSSLYFIQESVAQLENARCSIVGDGAVEFKKRVMILKQGKRYLPSAMELASRRRFQELYQGVLFSKKMEECEVMLQLRKAFEILGNASFQLAVADRNGVLDFRNGKDWNGDNISRWAKNACVLYLVPEVTLKGDPLDSFEDTNESHEARDPVEPNILCEELETETTRNFPETTPEKCDKRTTVYNLQTEVNPKEEIIFQEKCIDAAQMKVEGRGMEEEKLDEEQFCTVDEKVMPHFKESQDRKVNNSPNSTFAISQRDSDETQTLNRLRL